MKHAIIRFALAFSFVTHILSVNLIFAQEQYEIFEFGETGHIIKFPISQDKVVKEHRSDAMMKSPSGRKWVETFEYGETGQILEFPMTPQEIGWEKGRLARLKKNRNAVAPLTFEFEVVEMGDGHTVSFRKN